MMARPCYVVVALLLLAGVSRLGEGARNPRSVARISRQCLEYARQYGMAALKKHLSTTNLPNLSGSFDVGWFGSVSYDFWRLRVQSFRLGNLNLSPRPGQGITASLSNIYISVSGNWKVEKGFITLQGTFNLRVDRISIQISLNVGKDQSGRPTASVAHCSSSIGSVSIDISGSLSWILNLFHERIENNIKNIMEQKMCEIISQSSASNLAPYLRTLSITFRIDEVARIDYRLVGAPHVTSQGLDTPFKSKFFGFIQHSPVPFKVPPMELPQEHDLMVYFAVSQYVFNTASWVYHQSGHMNFTIRNEHLNLHGEQMYLVHIPEKLYRNGSSKFAYWKKG